MWYKNLKADRNSKRCFSKSKQGIKGLKILETNKWVLNCHIMPISVNIG